MSVMIQKVSGFLLFYFIFLHKKNSFRFFLHVVMCFKQSFQDICFVLQSRDLFSRNLKEKERNIKFFELNFVRIFFCFAFCFLGSFLLLMNSLSSSWNTFLIFQTFQILMSQMGILMRWNHAWHENPFWRIAS